MKCDKCSPDGSCGGWERCNSEGYGKLHVFDWLSDITLPEDQEPFVGVEVRFKNGRKNFYKNTSQLRLNTGDTVTVEADSGHDVGVVSLKGELAKIQMRKKKVDPDSEEVKKIYRKSTQADIDKWQEVIKKEDAFKIKARQLADDLKLVMKISDVEFQGDGSKATFYYTADHRVDFRQLIKEMARVFRTRIEMKQIGLRQEAARIGGISSSGRELCCSTWHTEIKAVSTRAARYQQLSLNPQRLTGLCGKLKCSLNFELDAYIDALNDFPDRNVKLKTRKGTAVCQKIDVFKKLMWYTYEDDSFTWHKLTTDQVKQIIEADQEGKPVESLSLFSSENNDSVAGLSDFVNVVEQNSLTRFDKPKRKKRHKKKRRKHKNRNE